MAQLLVRNLPESVLTKLKRRASAHGVSAEEEHRRILREALNRPATRKPSLAAFLLSDEAVVHPEVDLDTTRSREIETNRDVAF